MNIALTTIIIFIVLAPGYIARIAYHSSKLSISNPNKNLLNELILSIIPALIIQSLSIFLIEALTNYYIDFNILGELLMSVNDRDRMTNNFNNLEKFKYQIIFYNILVYLAAFCSGIGLRYSIRFFKLDRRVRFLRFPNKWHYIFSGECLDFPDVPDDYSEINNKIINVLCKVNGRSVLYSGEYFNYYVDASGNLEAVHLKYPIRRFLEDDRELDDDKKYFTIESRYLVIPNNDIININFRYFSLIEISEEDLTDTEKNDIIRISDKEKDIE